MPPGMRDRLTIHDYTFNTLPDDQGSDQCGATPLLAVLSIGRQSLDEAYTLSDEGCRLLVYIRACRRQGDELVSTNEKSLESITGIGIEDLFRKTAYVWAAHTVAGRVVFDSVVRATTVAWSVRGLLAVNVLARQLISTFKVRTLLHRDDNSNMRTFWIPLLYIERSSAVLGTFLLILYIPLLSVINSVYQSSIHCHLTAFLHRDSESPANIKDYTTSTQS